MPTLPPVFDLAPANMLRPTLPAPREWKRNGLGDRELVPSADLVRLSQTFRGALPVGAPFPHLCSQR